LSMKSPKATLDHLLTQDTLTTLAQERDSTGGHHMRSRRTPTSTRPHNPPYYQPPVQAALVVHKRLDEMSQASAVSYTEQLMQRLRKKQAREKNYLDGRARRGIRRSTDGRL